jgi:hypothetical protein
VREPGGRGGGAGLGALHAIDADGRLARAVENDRRLERDQVAHGRISVANRTGRIGNVSRLVGIDGDRIHLGERCVLLINVMAHRQRWNLREQLFETRQERQALRVHSRVCGERLSRGRRRRQSGWARGNTDGVVVASPGGVGMDGEIEAASAELRPQVKHVAQWVDRALLRAADDGDNGEDGAFGRKTSLKLALQQAQVHPGLKIDMNPSQAVLPEAEQRSGLRPGIVPGCRRHRHRRGDAGKIPGVEIDQADVLHRIALQGGADDRRVDVELVLDRLRQAYNVVDLQIEQRPGVADVDQPARPTIQEPHLQILGGAEAGLVLQGLPQSERKELGVARRPQPFDIGDRSVAGNMSPGDDDAGGRRPFGRDRKSQHAAEVVADVNLELRRDWRRFRRDVVLVVQHGAEIADQGR